MGRFTKMPPAEPPKEEPKKDPIDSANDEDSLHDQGFTAARNKPVINDHERYDRMISHFIKMPNEKLAADAIKQAAVIWSLTEKRSDKRDSDSVKFLARYLYTEALYWGTIDPRRALPRDVVDSWLKGQKFKPTTIRTYKAILHAAGRILYPGSYPPILSYTNPRSEPTAPATQELIDEIYALATILPPVHRVRLLLILDLTTQAGLRSPEMLDLRGSDVTARVLDTGERVAMIRVHRKGKVDRVVPVTCPIRSQRLLERAKEVGRAYFLPTPSGQRPQRATVGNAFQYLRERKFPTTTAEALRARWLVDMANMNLPAAVVARLAGKSMFRSLEKHSEHLDVIDPVAIAEMQLRARRPR